MLLKAFLTSLLLFSGNVSAKINTIRILGPAGVGFPLTTDEKNTVASWLTSARQMYVLSGIPNKNPLAGWGGRWHCGSDDTEEATCKLSWQSDSGAKPYRWVLQESRVQWHSMSIPQVKPQLQTPPGCVSCMIKAIYKTPSMAERAYLTRLLLDHLCDFYTDQKVHAAYQSLEVTKTRIGTGNKELEGCSRRLFVSDVFHKPPTGYLQTPHRREEVDYKHVEIEIDALSPTMTWQERKVATKLQDLREDLVMYEYALHKTYREQSTRAWVEMTAVPAAIGATLGTTVGCGHACLGGVLGVLAARKVAPKNTPANYGAAAFLALEVVTCTGNTIWNPTEHTEFRHRQKQDMYKKDLLPENLHQELLPMYERQGFGGFDRTHSVPILPDFDAVITAVNADIETQD